MGKRARKRGSAHVAGTAAPEPARAPEPRLSRSELKNAEARARLEPLARGERPRAVTIGALLAAALAVANLISYLAGAKIGGQRPAATGIIAFSALMLTMSAGMWRARYWAVLGMQALLALTILLFSGLLVVASNLTAVLVSVVIIAAGGMLFWFLVKALARIQMPQRAR